MAGKIRLFRWIIQLLCIACVAYGFPAKAASVGLDFYSQCPLLLQQAPSFAKECLLHARPWGQVFNDIPENHGAYIVVPKSGSNFTIGCTLGDRGQIDYLGVYYSLNSDNFKYADTAPMAFVDFEGNFGVFPKTGLINFIAIRRFSIDPKLKDPNYDISDFTTCEEPVGFPEGAVPDGVGDPYYILEKMSGSEFWITGCIFRDVCDPSVAYAEIHGVGRKIDKSKIIYTPASVEAGTFYITDYGGTLVQIPDLRSNCPFYIKSRSKGEGLFYAGVDMTREICISDGGGLK